MAPLDARYASAYADALAGNTAAAMIRNDAYAAAHRMHALGRLCAHNAVCAAIASGPSLRGAKDLRSRLVLATLARKKLEIGGIRADDESPGLRKEEASFVRLMDKLTSGSRIEINETGTTLRYAPGFLAGGSVEHDCSRSGAPSAGSSTPCSRWRPSAPRRWSSRSSARPAATARAAAPAPSAALPLLKAFGVEDCGVRVAPRGRRARGGQDRGAAGGVRVGGAGNIVLTCAPIREAVAGARAVGLVKRQRRRLLHAVGAGPREPLRRRGARPLNRLLADVRVTTDAAAKRDCFPSPGFGCCLVAETLDDRVLCADLDAHWYRTEAGDRPTPEDLGEAAAFVLLGEVNRGGVCDDHGQPLLFTLMALGPEDVSSAVTGPLTDRAVGRLRLIRQFLGVRFKLTRNGDGTVRSACLGAGYQNFAKPVT
ncbi:RNA-3'-phosphate cyclase [Aureococcus anophagefferens]|nr:RNA-3'-phosphate cyclase [Aureococcus anophagefferens]